ncbi:MAG: M28 family peptidase, partial [Deltaproteobacteria bacterium]|nr:M28 family peptidase [Deltaproteobacteria bacterium]
MRLPVESVATFRFVPGVDWSDHRSFWEAGYSALMMTDTAFYRNPHYHRGTDTPEKLDYSRMADLTRGLLGMLERLAP